MLTIECEEPTNRSCECCGGVTTSLTRFVFDDGDAYAAYYACFGPKHPDRIVQALVSIGEWGEGSEPWDRVAFPLEIRVTQAEFQIGLVDRENSPWKDVQVMGRVLDREEALAHERIQEVFHITDHMVVDDSVLRAYFDGAV
jgi:hypothetical protein